MPRTRLIPAGRQNDSLFASSECEPIARDGTTVQFSLLMRAISGQLVVSQIHVLVLHRPPQPLDHNVVERTTDAIHTDRDPRVAQHARKCLGGELAALVGVFDSRAVRPITFGYLIDNT